MTKPTSTDTFSPGPTPKSVRSVDGKVLPVPCGWILLPPGDAALSRRVKAAGDHWLVQEKKGNLWNRWGHPMESLGPSKV